MNKATNIALLGSVAREKVVYRNGAQTGDAIFVTGELGGIQRGGTRGFLNQRNRAKMKAIRLMNQLRVKFLNRIHHIGTRIAKKTKVAFSAVGQRNERQTCPILFVEHHAACVHARVCKCLLDKPPERIIANLAEKRARYA